jgi:hypothetical protein
MTQPTKNTKEMSCLDDFPEVAKKLLWQQRISRKYVLIALAPFTIVLLVVLKFFPESTNRLSDSLIFLTLAWAMIVACYAFYSLFWGVRCPSCGSGFGIKDKCRSCGLPRHYPAKSMFNEIRLFEEE